MTHTSWRPATGSDAAAPQGRARAGRVDGRAVEHHTTAAGARVDVDWLVDAGLPARYTRSAPRPLRLALRRLDRLPAAEAFTSDEGYREMDATDLGDEELDPFARRFILQGF